MREESECTSVRKGAGDSKTEKVKNEERMERRGRKETERNYTQTQTGWSRKETGGQS